MSIKFAKSNIIIKGATDNPIDDDGNMVFAKEVRYLNQRLSDDAIEYKGVSYECSKLCIVGRALNGAKTKEAYCIKRQLPSV